MLAGGSQEARFPENSQKALSRSSQEASRRLPEAPLSRPRSCLASLAPSASLALRDCFEGQGKQPEQESKGSQWLPKASKGAKYLKVLEIHVKDLQRPLDFCLKRL